MRAILKSLFIFVFLPLTVLAENDWERFLRVHIDASGSKTALETSVIKYINKAGVKVSLIGAVHVGEDSYYKALTEEFKRYDKVLYELVIPDEMVTEINNPNSKDKPIIIDQTEDHPKTKSDGERSIIHTIQTTLKTVLGLKFQLDEIDYKTKNFVHADMTDTELKEAFKKDNKGFSGLLVDAMLESYVYDKNNPDPFKELGFILRYVTGSKKSRMIELKSYMADQIVLQGGGLKAMEGSALIDARNDKALSVLDAQIIKGAKNLGIFYGAGHFGNMEQKLFLRGFTQAKDEAVNWLTAWDLTR